MVTIDDNESVLRQTRLWHWRQMVKHRNLQVEADRIFEFRLSIMYDKLASMHLESVQKLNDLFPKGDYAEDDNGRYDELGNFYPPVTS